MSNPMKSRRSNGNPAAGSAPRRSPKQSLSTLEIAALRQRVESLVEREATFEAALNDWVYKIQVMRITTEALLANAAALLNASRPMAPLLNASQPMAQRKSPN
jgi:hypothetical protein